jgi:hypothetical protein
MDGYTQILVTIFICLLIIIIYLEWNKKNKKHMIEGFEINEGIPKVIYLSYKTKDIPSYVIPNWKKLYPSYDVKLYDNEDCINFLSNEYGGDFVDIFNYIKDGPIKADFWRVCILYTYGGIYSDIDVEPLININDIVQNDITFVTCLSANNENINPHFIATTPRHDVLKKCIDTYLKMFKERAPYSYWGWSIVNVMRDVLQNTFGKRITEDGIYIDNKNQKYQMFKEVYPSTSTNSDHYCKYKDIKVLNNRYKFYDSINHTF